MIELIFSTTVDDEPTTIWQWSKTDCSMNFDFTTRRGNLFLDVTDEQSFLDNALEYMKYWKTTINPTSNAYNYIKVRHGEDTSHYNWCEEFSRYVLVYNNKITLNIEFDI